MTLSIIMPVYNVEKYLDATIRSIISQNGDFELILVDDGSSDSIFSICKRYEKEDPRVRVIHTENCGVSHARNMGIEASTGEYIEFVDSDDMLADGSVEKIMRCINASSPDVIIFPFISFGASENQSDISSETLSADASIADRVKSIVSNGTIVACWNKVYRRSVIANNRFREDLSYAEDYCFNLDVFKGVSSLVGIKEPLYRYRVATATLSSKYHDNSFDIAELIRVKTGELHSVFNINDMESIEKNYLYNMNAIIQRLAVQKRFNTKEKLAILKKYCSGDYASLMSKYNPGTFSKLLAKRRYRLLYWYIRFLNKKRG